MPDRTIAKLYAFAWQIMSYLVAGTKVKRTVQIEQGGITVSIAVNESNHEPVQYPGRWFSAAEQLVWDALEPDEWLTGKELAARLHRVYDKDPKFKNLLLNLEDRGVLLHEDGQGYARAPLNSGD